MTTVICVMEERLIFEQGSHEELILAGGQYAQLNIMQT
jgi:ABC-type multidrug transport system fused ATPase/permease subunit